MVGRTMFVENVNRKTTRFSEGGKWNDCDNSQSVQCNNALAALKP